uniref:PyrF1 n=1 Tax=Streptomyces rugosporus TaxID=295838 RepID=K7QVU5_STRRG|nr:PyrF1 [Streptomyces rugosporus]
MRLVERESHLRDLYQLYAESRAGRSQLALVSGAVAAGKSAVTHAFAERVAAEGAIVLSATASRTERAMCAGVAGQLLSSAVPYADDRLDAAAEALARVGDCARELADVAGLADEQAPRALTEAIFGLCERAPVVVVVDDVQHADVISLELLLYLLRRAMSRPVPLTVVLTEALGAEFAQPRFHAELRAHQHFRAIRLEPLSREGVADVLNDELEAKVARRFAAACHEVSGGNPLLVHALVEDLRQAVPADGELVPGEAYGRAVSACLHRTAPMVLRTARAMAVLGAHASPAVLAEVLEIDADSLGPAVDGLHELGLLSSGSFRHPVARTAVLLEQDDARLHLRAATVLHDHGTPATVVAEVIRSGRIEGKWTAPVLREAGAQALLANDVDAALAWLRAAERASVDEREQAAIKASLVRALWRRNPQAVRLYLPPLAGEAAQGRLSSRDAGALIGYLLWFGQAEQAAELLDGDAVRDADFLVTALGRAYPGLLGRVCRPATAALPGPIPLPFADAPSSMTGVFAPGAGDDALHAATQALQNTPLDDNNLPMLMTALTSLIHLHQLDVAARWGESLLKEAADRGAPTWQALFATLRAFVDLRRGRIADAERLGKMALTVLPPQGWGVAVGAPLATAIMAATAARRFDDAAAFLGIAVPDAMFETVGALHYLHARGRYHLAIDCPQAALADFERCGDLMLKWDLDLPVLVPWRVEAARAWAALGRAHQARDLVNEQLAALGENDDRIRGMCLRVLGSVAAPGEAVPLLMESVDLLTWADDAYELAASLEELGRAHETRGDLDRARELSRRARALTRETCLDAADAAPGLRVVAETLVERARADSPETFRRSQLTEAEMRVAVLAAQGHKNRQIAAELFITISTVEQHLTSVYRKLKANRRNDLGAALRRIHPGIWLGAAR